MVRHIAIVEISSAEANKINMLLDILSPEEMSDEELLRVGANTHQCEGIFKVCFDNGSTLNYDLCSGTHNYFDDVVWTSAITLECMFELDEFEFVIDGEEYSVKVDKTGF